MANGYPTQYFRRALTNEHRETLRFNPAKPCEKGP